MVRVLRGVRDLRLVALAAVAWATQLAAPALTGDGRVRVVVLLGAALIVGSLIGAVVLGRQRASAVAVLLVILGAGAVATLHAHQVQHNPVADLAERSVQVEFTATVLSDPRPVDSEYDTRELVRARVTAVTGRGETYDLRAPVLVLGADAWAEVEPGARVRSSGRLAVADDSEFAALVIAQDVETIEQPGVWWRASAAVRASVRDAVAHRPEEQAALVPALVDGDDAAIPDELADDFHTTGLTHLLAVSGTNLTLVVGFVLVVARWSGVRGRWLYLVGTLGILGFLILARTEPSVIRAAAMGAVGLLAMGHNGRERGTRGLGAAVLALLLFDPALAHSLGFALSVAATAGILLLGPAWRDALATWMPHWLAVAISVPAAAQLAVTPLIAAVSSDVSLVAVLANLLADPAVAPATVLGLLAGLIGLVSDPAGRLVGTLASWCVGWIVEVAQRCADLPMPSVGWGSGPVALVVLTLVCAAIAFGAPRVLRHAMVGVTCALVMVVVVAVRVPTIGGSSDDWSVAMCDVGQGDALALAAGPGSAVVVDAGPEPDLVDDCLDDLGITAVPLFVVTHFHADHVDGSSGVMSGRDVGEVWTTRQQDPPFGVGVLARSVAGTGATSLPAPYGESRQIGDVRLQVLWPLPDSPAAGPGDGSEANDQSVVLLAEIDGLQVLLTGDVEPASQAPLARTVPGLDVDVLKVPHHGSSHQDLAWLTSLRPEVALVSVGADNTYGHPAGSVLDALEDDGAEVHRTDEDGTVLVSSDGDVGGL